MRNLVIYGGTFDPIHNGHINTALNIQNNFNFDSFVFLPCKIPLLKNNAIATSLQRIEMLELALTEHTLQPFTINLSEINRVSPSYMVDSLTDFRRQFGNDLPITLIMGTDAYYQLPQWHAWEQILTLANLLVIKRAGMENIVIPDLIFKLEKQYEVHDKNIIGNKNHGFIYHFDAGHFNFSSSWIRQQLVVGKDMKSYVPKSVLEYIRINSLYLNRPI